MMAIILCAGFGTRLYPLTRDRPKALLEIGGRPLIDYLLDQLTRFTGLKTIHIVCNDRFYDHFVDWRGRTRTHGQTIVLHNDGRREPGERLGAMGDLAFVFNRLELEREAVISAADNIYLADLSPIWQRFVETGDNLIPVIRQDDPDRLRRTGVAVLGRGDRVIGFQEKPAEPPSPWSCPPLYFLNRRALQKAKIFADQPDPPDGLGYLIDFLLDEATIYAVKLEAGRLHIGDPDSYAKARRLLADQSVRDALPGA